MIFLQWPLLIWFVVLLDGLFEGSFLKSHIYSKEVTLIDLSIMVVVVMMYVEQGLSPTYLQVDFMLMKTNHCNTMLQTL